MPEPAACTDAAHELWLVHRSHESEPHLVAICRDADLCFAAYSDWGWRHKWGESLSGAAPHQHEVWLVSAEAAMRVVLAVTREERHVVALTDAMGVQGRARWIQPPAGILLDGPGAIPVQFAGRRNSDHAGQFAVAKLSDAPDPTA